MAAPIETLGLGILVLRGSLWVIRSLGKSQWVAGVPRQPCELLGTCLLTLNGTVLWVQLGGSGIFPTFGRLRQEAPQSWTSLGYRPCLVRKASKEEAWT